MRTISKIGGVLLIVLCVILHFSFTITDERLVVQGSKSEEGYYQGFPKFKNIYLNEKLFANEERSHDDFHFIYEKDNNKISTSVVQTGITPYDIYMSKYLANYFNYRVRTGEISDGKQEGEWLTRDRSFRNEYICRKEYFKNGIREGEYIIFSHTGDTLYSTVFVNGKGVEKDYYPNGQLYYVGAKDAGYFVDTLKVYRPDGMIIRKTLYRPRSIEKLYDKEYNYKRDTNLLAEVIINKTDNDTIYINEQYYPNGSLRYREYKLKDKYKYVIEGDKGKYLSNGGGYVKSGDYVRDVYSEYHMRDTITFDFIRVKRRQWQEKVKE